MSIVSWNCHGFGTPWALQFLKEVVLQKKPSYVFLCETLCRKGIVERVRSSLGFEGTIVVEAIGHSGGIALLWRNKDAVSLCSFSKNHIDGIVTPPEGVKYRLTGRDKRGGRPYPNRLLQGFQEVLNDCDLVDMNPCGYQYTWERGFGTSNHIEVRLDRALVSPDFLNLFKDAKLTNLEVSTFDHCPILLEPQVCNIFFRDRPFRFENAWLREPMCYQLVEDAWSNNVGSFYNKLSFVSEILSAWGKEITGNFKGRISKSKRILQALKGRRDDHSVKVVPGGEEEAVRNLRSARGLLATAVKTVMAS
ncbi:uncharacterized protein LOC141715036 [Apium graveolens]|uniref:uncharacterized protein LOC141715036 n=1 Tax=Apium graveolens TaxID=4045 RepID=UPI003D7A1C8B